MKTQLSAFLVGMVLAHAGFAADPDPPSLVARVSFVQGQAGLQAGERTGEQVELNRPVTIGDRVRTESQSLVELSLGRAAVRLDENTDVTVANLDEGITQLQLDRGVLSVHVFEFHPNENIEIDTPNAAVRLLEPGDYRIDVQDDGTTRLAVRHGIAELDGGAGPLRVRDQQQIVYAGADAPAEVVSLTVPDDFDEWSMARDRRFEDSQSAKYVSRDVVGYEDLDAYGSWDSDPEYGQVWYPTVIAAGWAPYRYGRWVWVQPWGWSWVDNSPWGFAPFHYGRWAYVRTRWCWVPGPRRARPVYAPALVAWDGGPRVGVAVSLTITNHPTRWFPLGPREVYIPAHRASPRYLRNVNVSNTVIVNNTYITNVYQNRTRDVRYMNRGAPNAITTREILPRVARPAPPARPLPPRPVMARGVAQREGIPITRPPRTSQERSSELDRARADQRDNLGARRLEQQSEQQREMLQQRQALQEQALRQRESQPRQLEQREQLQQRERFREQVQQGDQLQRREGLQRQDQVLRQEQFQRQQRVAEQGQRQQQMRAEQLQRQEQLRQQQQVRAQQAQGREQASARASERRDQARPGRADRP